MFHYYAQRAFAPVLASPYKDMNGDIVVEVISDAREDLIGVMRVRVVRADSLTPLIDENVPVLAVCEIIMRIHFPVARPSYIWTKGTYHTPFRLSSHRPKHTESVLTEFRK
jgi:hypothetical protein